MKWGAHKGAHGVGGDAFGADSSSVDELAVNAPVQVYPGTAQQQGGVIIEDFGESAGQAIDIGANRIAEAARRWAVRLNSGDLVFVDSHQLKPL
jgi:hypothetical protein